MVKALTWSERHVRRMHRLHARLAGMSTPPTGFVSRTEPRTVGMFARGRQLIAGNFMFAGHLYEAPDKMIWDVGQDNQAVTDLIQGCGWLDDLAAVGDAKARQKARAWVIEWIDRYGRGKGPGWTPELTGARLVRWINHALLILLGSTPAESDVFLQSLARQTLFLAKRWNKAPPGLPTFEALCGMVYAGLSLEGMAQYAKPALTALCRYTQAEIRDFNGLRTRNPEELLEVFTLLCWTREALIDSDTDIPAALNDAINFMAPVLRALRHADGGLARFHGGDRGIDGRLDYALNLSRNKTAPRVQLFMGYGRLSTGRTSVIIDAAPPPNKDAGLNAHASTCAFEMTSGRRPVIVNCGPGETFGDAWWRFGRATASSSTLAIDGYSSSRFGGKPRSVKAVSAEYLTDTPGRVPTEYTAEDGALSFDVAHDGYVSTHGLTHSRKLTLSADGRTLFGEDVLAALDDEAKELFDRRIKTAENGVQYAIRFHLHPDTDVSLDMNGAAASLTLKNREIWVLRHDRGSMMRIEPSVYLEKGRLKPRSSHQVVLFGHMLSYATQVRWWITKAADSPTALRDLVPDRETDLYIRNGND